ncbi:Uncharacterized protein Adt_24991 [Abeliophyllum distichum]|uniref:Uncharacterized protein n=1 Tax=Abeliophyllum distichum TaxID=126358 RepID=A0ABD1SG46_9LAMI
MMHSVCELVGHNSRHHLRPDAPNNDFFNVELEPMTLKMDNPVNAKSKGKMVPNRENKGFSSPGQNYNLLFCFMPTLGLCIPCAENVASSGHSTYVPTPVAARVVTKEVKISSMAEELQEIDAQEVTTEKDLRAQIESERIGSFHKHGQMDEVDNISL